jgi:hypothetical protein
MKYFLSFLLGGLLLAAPAQAQLLKKLKDKAQKALNGSDNKKPAEGGDQPVKGNDNGNDGNEPVNNNAAQKKVPPIDTSACIRVLTLDGASGETFLYDETRVWSDGKQLYQSFIVQNRKYEYFLIENGERKGPYKEAPLRSRKTDNEDNEGSDRDGEIQIGNDNKDALTLQYSKTIGGKLHIAFNGKNYGPYDYIAKIEVSPDKKRFFAVVTIGGASSMTAKMGMGNIFIVNESGLKQKVVEGNGIPSRLLVSNGFKQAMVMAMDQSGGVEAKVLSVSTTGKKEEASMTDLYGNDGGIRMVNDAGDIITVPGQSPTQILVNGNEAASFQVPIKSRHRLFLTPDVKKSVYYNKGRIYRGDGSMENVSYITFPHVVTQNGQSSIYYYRIEKKENGDKNVWLCKKDL